MGDETAFLRRQGHQVSFRQVDRLMRHLGLNGRVRGRGVRTTIPDRNAARAPDLLDRDFTAPVPNQRWVADFTYVRTWAGFAYVSFVIDCYSRAIVGWHAATIKTTPLVTTALRVGSGGATGPAIRPVMGSCITPMPGLKADSTGRRNTLIGRC
jgi:putative transposase